MKTYLGQIEVPIKFKKNGKFVNSAAMHIWYRLSPPLIKMPYGLKREDDGRFSVKTEGKRLAGDYAHHTKVNYRELPFSGSWHILGAPVMLLPLPLIIFPAYAAAGWGEAVVSIIKFYMAVYVPYLVFAAIKIFTNRPTIIFNRLRGDIYIYHKKYILICQFSKTLFVLNDDSLVPTVDLVVEIPHPTAKSVPIRFMLSGIRDYDLLASSWVNLYRLMERKTPINPEDEEQKKGCLHWIFSLGNPAHRWPDYIEWLLLPENKDAPLPKGISYDTWIPCNMPRWGFKR